MSEKEYQNADYEVIGMVNRKAGQLPRKSLTFIPTERAERVEALDRRIRQFRKIAPYVGAVLIAAISMMIGRMM